MVACNLTLILTDPDIFIVKHSDKWRGDWARGFIRGAAMRPNLWHEPMKIDETGLLLMPMILESAGRMPNATELTLPIERREDTSLQMLRNFTIIYHRFEGLRRSTPSGFQTSEVAPAGWTETGGRANWDDQQMAFNFRKRELFENDADDFPIRCPACGSEFFERIETLKLSNPPCPTCGLPQCGVMGDVRRVRQNHHAMDEYMRHIRFLPIKGMPRDAVATVTRVVPRVKKLA